ncbi:hypothetical protein GCM10011348_35150 [Marinobacterium nitratireducens]|uniref:Lipoprotein n=1 Tax=Marinobacterium nitratireducens TaxID=518897 RepID=A0A917ZLT2_9GAMM|nr:hypothetical protein [Marinobacterium nitratireducens]GGO85789.1 hypothetical protein GCM10011348_35150 [Marinobacterium nitratireducens]
MIQSNRRSRPAIALMELPRPAHPDTLHRAALLVMLATAVLLGGCGFNQNYSSAQHNDISLSADALSRDGVAFISPSTTTGQEEDKQTLALVFARTLVSKRPDIRVVSLPETLGAVNRAGLAREYNRMFEDYGHSGILSRDTLQKIGKAANARYLVQLNLGGFSQESRGRFSMLGFRVYQTTRANIRLYVQVWDTLDGSIAWEGVEELNLAQETGKEKSITFTSVVEATAENLIALLPPPRSSKVLSQTGLQ